ncbi:hypothetical protein COP2_012681 [Malus domestica]
MTITDSSEREPAFNSQLSFRAYSIVFTPVPLELSCAAVAPSDLSWVLISTCSLQKSDSDPDPRVHQQTRVLDPKENAETRATKARVLVPEYGPGGGSIFVAGEKTDCSAIRRNEREGKSVKTSQ